MIKVAYILPTGPMYGDNIALRTILPYLVQLGVEPLIIARAGSDTYRQFSELGYTCISHEWYYSTMRTQAIWRATLRRMHRWEEQHIELHNSEYRHILQEVRTFSPDLIHTNCSYTNLGLRLAADLHVPHVMHIREYGQLDSSPHYPTDAIFGLTCRKRGRYNITITRDIQRYLNLPDACARPIYDGVFADNHPYLLSEQKQRYFLFVGRIAKTKGVHIAIEAFARFNKQHPDYQLLIAGSGNDEAYNQSLKEQIASYSLEDKVRFLGYRTDTDQLMQAATALLVPSRFEAFGFISAEALYQGCPVIGHKVAGTQEQFDNVADIHTAVPMFYTYSTVEECAQAMHTVAQNKPTLADMQTFHDRVFSLYPAEKSAKNVFAYYQYIRKSGVKRIDKQ